MRFIKDNQPPQELIGWIAQQRRAGVSLHYDNLGTVAVNGEERDVKRAIINQRLHDQGYLCAYTMVRLDEENCHIEHIIPRSVSNVNGQPQQTVTYKNLLACYPLEGECKFGARARENRLLPFTPLDANCETRIRYERNGEAKAAITGDRNAEALIDSNGNLLRLNHTTLVGWRQHAITGAGLTMESKKLLSPEEARRFAKDVVAFVRGQKLTPYCVALAHAAEAHAKSVEKLSRKRKFSREVPH